MTSRDMEALLRDHRMVAVLRTATAEQAESAGRAVIDGGARIVEVTWTVPDAARVLTELKRSAPGDVAVGAGTIVTEDDLERAVAAGADFVISPDVHPPMIAAAAARDLFHVPGAMTPTEILSAHRCGAPFVKIFPVASLGGTAHVRALRGPIPSVPLLVTGGVDLESLPEFLAAGATAVGLSNTLLVPEWIAAGDYKKIAKLTARYIERLAA